MRRTNMIKAREILRLKRVGLSIRVLTSQPAVERQPSQKYCHWQKS